MLASEIDVSRDLFNFEVQAPSSAEDKSYYLQLRNWSEEAITLQIEFVQPGLISKDGLIPDIIILSPSSKGIIRDRDTGSLIQFDPIVTPLPPQEYNLTKLADVESRTEIIYNTVKYVGLISLATLVVIGKPYSYLLVGYFYIQLVGYLTFYNAPRDIEFDILLGKLRKVTQLRFIEFP